MSDAVTKDELDWARFTAAYLPGARRPDAEALTAYGAYRRSRVNRDRPSDAVQRTPALAVRANEGGPAL
jgi:hypothetical protein